MKVYVVTEGEYSDYHIVGVTLDKEIANSYADCCAGEIEEYETDDFKIIPKGWKPYSVWFGKTVLGKPFEHVDECYIHFDTLYKVGERDGMLHVGVIAKDEEHAIKIASEKVAEYKAQKEGIT